MGMERGKKVSLRRFLADQKIAISYKICVLGHPIGTSNKLVLIARHIMTTGPPKMPLKLAV